MKTKSKTRGNAMVLMERYQLCPSCGNFAHYAEGLEFCIRCGEKLIEQCSKCSGPIIYPTARYCPSCGEALVRGTQSKPVGAEKV